MKYEVEQKFVIAEADVPRLEKQLAALGAAEIETVTQYDTYFAHPARDFAQTDEALRIRRQGNVCWLTYKGPKIDPATKTRREIELPLVDVMADSGRASAAGDAAMLWTELLTALGFRAVADVRKNRRTFRAAAAERPIEVALDFVEELGWFVELELVADENRLAEATSAIAALAAALRLTRNERRSYLELLLAR